MADIVHMDDSWKNALFRRASGFLADETGQDMVEYSLLLVFIALAVVGLLSGIKTQLTGILSTFVSTCYRAAVS